MDLGGVLAGVLSQKHFGGISFGFYSNAVILIIYLGLIKLNLKFRHVVNTQQLLQ